MAGLLRSAVWLRSRLLLWRGGCALPGPVPSPSAALRRFNSNPSRAFLMYPTRLFAIAVQENRDVQEPFPIQQKQIQFFDWAFNKMDTSIRKNGCITKSLLEDIFHDACKTGFPNGNQALLLLRSCGSLLPELPPDERTALAHTMWSKLKGAGVVFDVSHYNALLKVYLQNEHDFSPDVFLTKMEEANVQPNRVTYQRLIAAYCNKGDIDGSRDMDSAVNILSVMKDTKIEPGSETYLALLNAYAEKGNINQIEEELKNIEKTEIYLSERDFMDIIFTLAKAGYPQYVQNILEKIKFSKESIPDVKNLCLRLITFNLEDTAFEVLHSVFVALGLTCEKHNTQCNFFLQHCINMEMPLAKLKYFCDNLKASNLHPSPLLSSLFFALEAKKTDLAIGIMKIIKEEGLCLKPHYFWPLLAQHQENKNTEGVINVLKAMDELEVKPSIDTYLLYVFTNLDNPDPVRQRILEKGCPLETSKFLAAEIRHEASNGRLNNVYQLLSSPNILTTDRSHIRNSLILGFRRCIDVDLWKKITELFYMEEEKAEQETENIGRFLYSLIDNMTDSEIQDKEEQLRQYFHQLHKMNVTILPTYYKGIRKLLSEYKVPNLIKSLISSHDLEEKLQQLKAENKPIGDTLKNFIFTLCSEKNMQRALEVKAKYEFDMNVVGYGALIRLCCQNDNVEEAMNLKEEFCRKDSSDVLELNTYIELIKTLVKHERLDDAINILKEMKEKNVCIKDSAVTQCFRTLNNVAIKGEVEKVTQLHEAMVCLLLPQSSVKLCSPLVTVHLQRDDLLTAVEVLFDCYRKYGGLPRLHEILCGLIEKGDTETVKKVFDFLTEEKKQMGMMFDLFFAFLVTGKYKEAKKIIETPGLRAKPERLEWFANKCIANNNGESLEAMVTLTQNLFDCDRDKMYYSLLLLCQKNNDLEKAESVWTKMQEENIVPRSRTLHLLGHIFKANNQKIPFTVPENWYESDDDSAAIGLSSLPQQSYQVNEKINEFCKNDKHTEAYRLFLMAKDFVLNVSCYNNLIKALLSHGSLEEAMEVKKIAENHIKGFVLNDAASSLLILTQVRRDYLKEAMSSLHTLLKNGKIPSQQATTRLVQAFAQKGDEESIREMEKLIEPFHGILKLPRMLFINNTALARIKNNNCDAATEYIEEKFISRQLTEDANLSFVFRRLIEDKEETALEKLSAMVERLANQFGIYKPVTHLFLQYIEQEKVKDAELLLQRNKAISEQRSYIIAFIIQKARTKGQSKKIRILQDLIPDFKDQDQLLHYLLKSYYVEKDVVSCKAVYEEMKAKNIGLNELSLKRLAVLLKEYGQPVPFTEPPESFTFYAEKLKNEKESLSSDDD
ncbi:Leucine-rich PPR motif-containing protein, mitochondrial [Ophiophagus hannah]|uniref:Leucine-rich PPR motif-containing protein, mitochondrial n=1 Tax=Ophiophagus hannah TaxID=8665 RepID=V8PD84_OPHHA|nr:Leucine-rich PPR motif-containing protein, mitochondrial [Ophiophagus hannah]